MTTMEVPIESAPAPAPAPWYRRWYAWAAGGAVITLAVVLPLVLLLGGSPSGAAGILQRDGYTVTRTLTADQVRASALASGNDGQMIASIVVGDAAAGMKGNNEEAAVKLSPSGKTMITVLLPVIQSAGVTVRIDGDYLVISGSKTALDNSTFGLGG